MPYAIEMLNIVKDFPGIRANDDITLQVEEGTVHALLGENGAGKSTLMSILFGLYQPTSGVIKVRGKEVAITSPNVANELGIGMVHQHFKLIDCFTVTENIILGSEIMTKFGTIDFKSSAARIQELSDHYGLKVDPYAKVENITVGMQQRVEILKMLYRNNDILIFDEPTAVLTPQEIDELLEIMRNLIQEGKTILLITHKLKEIKAIANKCTVIRKGKGMGTVDVATTDEVQMAELMVGRHVSFKVDKKPCNPGRVVLEVENLHIKGANGLEAVKGISFKVREGEILGIAGIDGNGQSELIYGLTGLMKIDSGTLRLNGKEIEHLSIKDRALVGMSHIPEDRHKHGLILDFTLEEDFAIHDFDTERFSKNGILDFLKMRKHSDNLINEFDVRSGQGSDTIVRSMSGGNQQKAVIAREIDRAMDLMVVVQPTRGLDVGAIEIIHKRLVAERDKGKAIILVSLELDEVMNLSDRILVMYNGQFTGHVMASEVNENDLGLMMSGAMNKETVKDV